MWSLQKKVLFSQMRRMGFVEHRSIDQEIAKHPGTRGCETSKINKNKEIIFCRCIFSYWSRQMSLWGYAHLYLYWRKMIEIYVKVYQSIRSSQNDFWLITFVAMTNLFQASLFAALPCLLKSILFLNTG